MTPWAIRAGLMVYKIIIKKGLGFCRHVGLGTTVYVTFLLEFSIYTGKFKALISHGLGTCLC